MLFQTSAEHKMIYFKEGW